jgi:MSHA biogenesis protein MshP
VKRSISRRPQQGASSLVVVALVVILGGLTAHAVGLVTAQADSGTRALAHGRATQAAEAGLDWARFRLLAVPAPVCAAAQTITTLPGTLQPYAVTVRCTAGPVVNEGGVAVRQWRIQASACSQPAGGVCPNAAPGADYVERTLTTLVVR